MELLKICFFGNTSWYVYNFRKNLIKKLIKKGYKVYVMAPYDLYSEKLKEMACLYYDISMDSKSINPIHDVILIRRIRKELLKIGPDLLLNFTIKPNVYGSIAANGLGIKCVNNVAGMGTLFTEGFLARILFKSLFKISQKKVSTVFFQNPDDMNELTEGGIVKKNISELLPGSGVNLNDFPYSPIVSSNKRNINFLLISRMIYPKGIVELIKASKALSLKGYTNFKINLLGELGVNNPNAISKHELNELCSSDYVEYIGKTDSVKKIIEKSDVVVLPSYYREGTPKSLLEGLAIGRPILTTNTPGCKETVIDGLNGFLCEPKSVSDLTDKMEMILKLNFEEKLKMGQESRKLAERKFNEEIVINKYMRAISKTLNTK
jgi:glycosyltransferase involved in cell wall biosynthesis